MLLDAYEEALDLVIYLRGVGQYRRASGTGNTGWKAAGFQPFTTAGRPAASLAGIGGAYYDTTLNHPTWSDGTDWRDATGTIV